MDVAPLGALLQNGEFQAEADISQDGVVALLDVTPFVDLLVGDGFYFEAEDVRLPTLQVGNGRRGL